MPFTSITINETFELRTHIGSLWRKIEASYEIGEGEDEYIARDKIKSFLDESHRKYYSYELPKALPSKKEDLYFNETTRKYEK